MSAYDEFDDELIRPNPASVREIAGFLWRHWMSQPGKLWGFIALFSVSATCELLLPLMSSRLVEALTAGADEAARQGLWAYGAFTLVAFLFFST
ncbi:MAG: hypothetical protein AB7T08_12400, partial [Hyphomonadaceae bacterium]